MSAPTPLRLVLAEDSTLLRAGLTRLLTEEGHEVLAAVGDAHALEQAAAAWRPQVVITDVRMPPTHSDDGLRAAVRIRAARQQTGVLVLSQYVEKRYATELLAEADPADGTRGGIGYLLKDRVAQVAEFLDALRRVAAGATVLDPEVVRQLLARSARQDPLSRLTDRERTVLEAMAQGSSNPAIAALLHVSRSAVEKHVNAIFDKLDLAPTSEHNRRVLAVVHYLQG